MKIPVKWLVAAVAVLTVAHYLFRVDEADVRSVVQIRPSASFVAAEPNAFYAVNPAADAGAPEYLCSLAVAEENLRRSPPVQVRVVNIWGHAVPLMANVADWEAVKDKSLWPKTELAITYRYKYLVLPTTAAVIPCETAMIAAHQDGLVICQVQHVYVTEGDTPIGISFRRKGLVPVRTAPDAPAPTCPLVAVEQTWKAKWDVVLPETFVEVAPLAEI